VLEGLLDGDVHNRIVVPEPDKQWARTALNRMLELV
jgi:quinolinate synthase